MADKRVCPHCGDNVGFYTYLYIKDIQIYTWAGEGADSSTIKIKEGKKQRCMKCNKIVKVKLTG